MPTAHHAQAAWVFDFDIQGNADAQRLSPLQLQINPLRLQLSL